LSLADAIIPLTIGGSYVYMANTAAAFLGKKAYPYYPSSEPDKVKFKKYSIEEATNLDLESHCKSILGIYDPFVRNKKFPAAIFGSPNGGIVNLAVAMGVPYLCSQFRTPILLESGGTDNKKDKDDLSPYVQVVEHIGRVWTKECPWASVSCLVDPIHDRMDIGEYAHVRAKFNGLPSAFKQFLFEHLQPKSTIIFVNTTYPWLTHRIAERIYLQIGGLGGILPTEYLTGSERVKQFLKSKKSKHQNGWRLTDYPIERRPESEWGTEPKLKKAAQEFCDEHGYDFVLIEQDHPAGYNLLAAQALHRRHTADHGKCTGYSTNIFWGLCPTLMLRARLLGCWFTFTDSASLNISERQLQILLNEFPDVPKRAIMGYWSYPDAKLLDVVAPSGWLDMLSKYIPKKDITTPGLTDLENTEHNIFKYEDTLFDESKRFEGKESKHDVTIEELRTILR
jgi:hypothetical protein